MLRSKQPPVAREFSWGVHFELGVESDCDITSALFDRGAECTSTVRHGVVCRKKKKKNRAEEGLVHETSHGARARMTHQPRKCVGGWVDDADKVHKQGEHILQHCYVSHNHPALHK